MNDGGDNNESGPWSFRDKRDINKKEKDLIYKITQKLNQTLINVTQNKNKNQLHSFDKKMMMIKII